MPQLHLEVNRLDVPSVDLERGYHHEINLESNVLESTLVNCASNISLLSIF